MQGTMPGARRRGRPRTAWMDSIKTWTGLPVKESIRMTEDRDKRRKQRSNEGSAPLGAAAYGRKGGVKWRKEKKNRGCLTDEAYV